MNVPASTSAEATGDADDFGPAKKPLMISAMIVIDTHYLGL